MRHRLSRAANRRRTGGVLLATASMLSAILVSVSTGVSGAAPVSTEVPAVCVGADAETTKTLNLAKALIGTDKVFVKLIVTAKDIPSTAGLEEEINAQFSWAGTLDQNLIDKSAGLGLKLVVSNIKSQMSIKGPSSVDAFSGTGTNTTIAPVVGKPAVLSLGTLGGPIKTTAGGIITYRVAGASLTAALDLKGQKFVLNLNCSPTGSNLIAKTSVKDPDAPVFSPEIYKLNAAAGGTVSVDLLKDVISPGKTPLIGDSLKIVESPTGGTASLTDGKFTFTAPSTAGTYSTTVEICGEPKPDSGIAGVSEVQKLNLGSNWKDGVTGPRPVAFTLKSGDNETGLIWTTSARPGPVPHRRVPTPENWAPENKAGVINDYLLLTDYKRPTAAAVQAALEALPNIGSGNVEVTDLKENEKNVNSITGFKISFINDLKEQDVPAIELGQWYTVPPQEILDRIGEAVAGLADKLGGGEGTPELTPFQVAAGIKLTDDTPTRIRKADTHMGNRIRESLTGGKAVSQAEWDGWADTRIMGPLMESVTDAVPGIIDWLNSLFPEKPVASTLTPGEAPVPPAPLCAQGIIEVTVAGAEVSVAPPPQVGGKNERRPTFTG